MMPKSGRWADTRGVLLILASRKANTSQGYQFLNSFGRLSLNLPSESRKHKPCFIELTSPFRSHIRQLLYIALYPPPLPLAINEKGKEKEAKEPFEPTTPSKSTVKQAQRSPLVPSLRATEAALRVLVSFAITNSPGSLARALPECLNVSDWNAKLTEVDENLEEDSYIAREAMCIKEARHAWAILREGLIQRKTAAPTIPKGKGKKRRRDYEYVEEEEIRFDGDGVAPLAIVAEHAWPILDWLLMVFESDELITEKSGLSELFHFDHKSSILIWAGSPTFTFASSSNSTTTKWDGPTMGGRCPPRYRFLLSPTDEPET